MGLGVFRLLLAIGVIASHVRGYEFSRYPDTGIIAVVTFFFISGYLMLATFETNYHGPTFASGIRRFYTNRALRIFPLYWLALILTFGVIMWKQAYENYDFSPRVLLQNFLLIGLNQDTFWASDIKFVGPAWTLDIELQFYVLVPFLIWFHHRYFRLYLTTVLLVSLFGTALLVFPAGTPRLDQTIFPYAGFFVLGMLSYHYRSHLPAMIRSVGYLAAAIGLAVACIACMGQPRVQQWLIVPLILMVALPLLQKSGSALDRYLGDLAYPVFILHPVVLLLGMRQELSFFASLAFNTVVTLILADISHRITSPYLDNIRSRNRTDAVATVLQRT